MNSNELKMLGKARDLFKQYGFKSVTMDDVSKALGISKKTLYTYVANKKELVSKIIDLYIEEEGNCTQGIMDQNVDAVHEMFLIAEHVRLVYRDINQKTIYELEKYYKESSLKINTFMTTHIYENINKNLRKGIKNGLYKQDIPVEIIARFYVSNANSMKDETIFPPHRFSKGLIVSTLLQYHLRSITTVKGEELINKYIQDNHFSQLSNIKTL